MREQIQSNGSVLLPALGIRGDDGWRLNPEALPVIRKIGQRLVRAHLAKRAKAVAIERDQQLVGAQSTYRHRQYPLPTTGGLPPDAVDQALDLAAT